jgi:hypothetical protein
MEEQEIRDEIEKTLKVIGVKQLYKYIELDQWNVNCNLYSLGSLADFIEERIKCRKTIRAVILTEYDEIYTFIKDGKKIEIGKFLEAEYSKYLTKIITFLKI